MNPLLLTLVCLPLVVAVVSASIREPMKVALPLFAVLMPFGGSLSVGDSPFLSLSSLAGLLLGLSLLLQLTSRPPGIREVPLDVALWILFAAAAILTAVWSVDLPKTMQSVALLLSLVVLYVLAAMTPVDALVLRRTENALIMGAVVAVGYGVAQLLFLGGFPTHAPGSGPAPTGRFGNDLLGANLEAVALVLPFAIAVHRAFASGSRDVNNRWHHAILSGVILVGILMTASRAGLLAAGLALATLAFSGPRHAQGRLLVFTGLGAAVAFAVWAYHPAGLATRTFESATSSSGRTDIWRVGASACSHYCGYGSGWGTFPTVYAQTQATVPGARVLVGEGTYQPHNVWLLVAVELGVIGLALFAGVLLAITRDAARLSPERRGPSMAGLAGVLVGTFFLSSLEFKFFWMALLLIAINRNLENEQDRGSRPAPQSGRIGGGLG